MFRPICLMIRQQDPEQAKIIARNVHHIRIWLDLTPKGFSAAVDISVNHLRLIERGESNITSRTAGKIADFAGIEVKHLFSLTLPKLKKPENIPTVKKFYEDNRENYKYFISRKGENSVANFIRTVLIPDGYFKKQRKIVGIIVRDCRVEYKKRFTSKELSRQLGRLADKGALSKKDPTGTGKKFAYGNPDLPDDEAAAP